MAGTMGCLLLFVIILHISTVSGVVEISFEKGVPRLNNSLYCDYYFACHTEGETLQWRVGNTVFNYFGQSTITNVFVGSVSNCNFTTTLLSLKPLPSSLSFKSALILTCQSNFNLSIICSDGSSLKMINIPEKESSLMVETTNSSIYLEHVLSQNLVNADNSTCTNVFVCGVNNYFMEVQLGNTMFLFGEFDSIGVKRIRVQDTSVQQAILIDKEPYSLVVTMFIVGSEVMNVTCGFSQNITFLSGMQCRPVTTMPETTGTMEFESSTEGESSTIASGGSSTLPLILGLIIALVVLVAIIIIIIFIVFGFFIIRKLKLSIQKIGQITEGTPLEPMEGEQPEAGEEVGLEAREDAEAGAGEEVYLEKIEVRDVKRNGVTYLAINRGTYKPQLKLEDGDEIATLNLKQEVVISDSPVGYYPMKAKKHGVCLIISNRPAQPGTEHDEHNLIETWCYLGYHIEVRREVKYEEFENILCNIDELLHHISEKHYQSKLENDSFVCFITAHPYDQQYNINSTDMECFLNDSKILQGIPKMFFIGFPTTEHGNYHRRSKILADTLISYAASEGEESYQHDHKGSVYIQVVCKILCEEAKQRNLNDLQNLINIVLFKKMEGKVWHYSHNKNTLVKNVHFFF